MIQLLDRHTARLRRPRPAPRRAPPARRPSTGCPGRPSSRCRRAPAGAGARRRSGGPSAARSWSAEALGTAPYFPVPGEALGVHPALRLTPAARALAATRPEHLLPGHGEPVEGDDLGRAHPRAPSTAAAATSRAGWSGWSAICPGPEPVPGPSIRWRAAAPGRAAAEGSDRDRAPARGPAGSAPAAARARGRAGWAGARRGSCPGPSRPAACRNGATRAGRPPRSAPAARRRGRA